MTPFGEIMKRVVKATPGAIGGAFAARDGELVDAYTTGDPYDFAVMTAHFGVVLAQLVAAFGTLHHGDFEAYLARYHGLDVVACVVDDGYYALVAMRRADDRDHEPFGDALPLLASACRELAKEMA